MLFYLVNSSNSSSIIYIITHQWRSQDFSMGEGLEARFFLQFLNKNKCIFMHISAKIIIFKQ